MHPEFYKSILERKNNCKEFLGGHPPKSLYEKAGEISAYALANNVPTDSYGEGIFVRNFEKEVAAMAGQEDGIFMPTGAMAQQIACRIWSERTGTYKIAMHPTCQLEVNEFMGYKKLHGLDSILIGEKNRRITVEDLADLNDVSVLIIENPMRALGGAVIPFEELVKMVDLMKSRNIMVHLDAARVFGCLCNMKVSTGKLCALFDSVYLSLYKGIQGMNGAVLLGTSDFIKECRVWRRRQGGEMKEIGYLVVSAKLHLEKIIKSSEKWYEKALQMAAVINGIPHMKTIPLIPESNMMQVVFNSSKENLFKINEEIFTEFQVWMFDFFMDGARENECVSELVIYDAALQINGEKVFSLLQKISRQIS